MINEFNNFLIKNVSRFSIKYLSYNYKIKFYKLTSEEICHYDSFLHTFLIMMYFYKSKQYKNYVNYKIKLVFNLLNDKTIQFVDSSLNYYFQNYLTDEYIMEYLNDKYGSRYDRVVPSYSNDEPIIIVSKENSSIIESVNDESADQFVKDICPETLKQHRSVSLCFHII